jgi:arsenite oxidase large subunit
MVKVAAHREGKTLHQKLNEYGSDGLQAPVLMREDGSLEESLRLHDIDRQLPETGPHGSTLINKVLTRFKTQTGKLNLQKAPWHTYSDFWEFMRPKDGELWCTTGRINERWQSGFDDKRKPYLNQRWPENWAEINTEDAAERGIESGDYVMMYSDRVPIQRETILGVEPEDFTFTGLMENGHIELTSAAITAVAIVTPAIKKGVTFSDFLQKASPGNALTARVPDWISGNYNFKMGVGRLKKIGVSPYKGTFRSMSFAQRDIV